MKPRHYIRGHGFTLMEIAAAIAMFTIAVAGTTSVLYSANRASRAAHAHHLASLAAQSEIERLRAAPSESLQECTDKPLPVSDDLLDQVPSLALSLSVTDVPETSGELKEVRVAASWRTGNTRRSLEIPTLITLHAAVGQEEAL